MKIELISGDITTLEVDAIVNAANSSLMGGGGVDGRIHQVAGPALQEACSQLGGCPPGEARITPAFNLPCKYVIHTVGPIWKGGNNNEEDTLKRAYQSALELVVSNKIKTVAFPNISTGIYGFPKERAAFLAIQVVTSFDKRNLKRVCFVCFEEENYGIYREILNSVRSSQFF